MKATNLRKLIADLQRLEAAYGGDLVARLQGARWEDGTCSLQPVELLIARAHAQPSRGLVGHLRETPDSTPVLVILNRHAND